MRYRTELMEAILQSRHAQQMIDFIAPVYGESFTALWLLEVIGRVLDNAASYGESLEQQTVPQTVSWAIAYWEQEFGIFPDPFETLEERRNNILTKLGAAPPANPYMLAALAESIAGVPCKIIENVSKNTFILEMYGLSPSRIRAKNAVWQAKPAHLFMCAACRFPSLVFTERSGNLLLRTLRMRYRMRFYEGLVELDGQKRLDGSWKLGQVIPGFAFPQFQCVARIKHNYREQLIALDGSERLDGGWKLHQGYPAMRFITRFWNDDEGLQCAALEIGTAFQNPHGGMRKAALRFGAGYKNVITYSAPEMRFHARVTNRCGSMNGTLQKGIARKMDGTYQFNGAITFRKTQSIKEEL